jgi:hypothetical protein
MEKEDEEEVEEILSKPGSKRDYRLGFVIFYALTITLGSFQWGYTFTFYNVIVKTMEIVLGEVNHSGTYLLYFIHFTIPSFYHFYILIQL